MLENKRYFDLDIEIGNLFDLVRKTHVIMEDQQSAIFEIKDAQNRQYFVMNEYERASFRHLVCVDLVREMKESVDRLDQICKALMEHTSTEQENTEVMGMIASIPAEKIPSFLSFLKFLSTSGANHDAA